MALERSNSLEYIELLPTCPSSLDASISSGGTDQKMEKEKEEEYGEKKSAAKVTHRRPSSLLRKNGGHADAEEKTAVPSR